MEPAPDEHEAAQEPRVGVRIRRSKGTSQAIPEPGGFQPALPLGGYPAPHPDETKAHVEMAYELAREVIEQARIARVSATRMADRNSTLSRYRARSLRTGDGERARNGEKRDAHPG